MILALLACAATSGVMWDPACDGQESWSNDGNLFAGRGDWLETHTARTLIESEGEWGTIQAAAAEDGVELAAVDFATRWVIIGGNWIPSSCDAGVSDHGIAYDDAGAPYLHATFYDHSAGCKDSCGEEWALLVIYELERAAGEPTACLLEEGTCEAA